MAKVRDILFRKNKTTKLPATSGGVVYDESCITNVSTITIDVNVKYYRMSS